MNKRTLKKFIKRGVYSERLWNKYIKYWHASNTKEIYYKLSNNILEQYGFALSN